MLLLSSPISPHPKGEAGKEEEMKQAHKYIQTGNTWACKCGHKSEYESYAAPDSALSASEVSEMIQHYLEHLRKAKTHKDAHTTRRILIAAWSGLRGHLEAFTMSRGLTALLLSSPIRPHPQGEAGKEEKIGRASCRERV
jgi:hypothetical protein